MQVDMNSQQYVLVKSYKEKIKISLWGITMSRLYYFASDEALEEQHNPYVKLLSVNQALELGVTVDLDLFGDNFDKDKPEVILFCEDEAKFEYPNIFSINKEKYYDDIGTSRQFCTALEWNYSEDTVDVIIKYIENHLKTAPELELWNVWLGSDEIPANGKKTFCKVSNLTTGRLKEFYNSELDFQCLTIVR